MKVLGQVATAQEIARLSGKPVLFIGGWDCLIDAKNSSVSFDDLKKAAPYFEFHSQCGIEGSAVIICDSDDERDRLFDLTVGDDGPTKTNPYDGLARVYALTINREGETENENT